MPDALISFLAFAIIGTMNTKRLQVAVIGAVALLSCGAAWAAPGALQIAEAHDAAAKQYEQQRRLPEAAAEYQQVIRYQPHWSEGYMGLAWALRDESRPQDAEQVLREAVRVNPKSAECYYGLGDMLLEQHRTADSITPFLKSVQLNPRLWMGYYQLGGVYAMTGQWHNSLIVDRAWARRQPGAVDAHDGLAYDYEQSGSSRAAATEYRLALHLDPYDPLAADNLGCILARQGHRAEAHQLWQRVLTHPSAGHLHPDGTLHSEETIADVRQMLVKYP